MLRWLQQRWGRRAGLLATFGMISLCFAQPQLTSIRFRNPTKPLPVNAGAQDEEEHHSHADHGKSGAKAVARRLGLRRRRLAGRDILPVPDAPRRPPLARPPPKPRSLAPRFVVPRYAEPPEAAAA